MAATTKRARYGQMSRAPKDINIKAVPADVRNGMLRLKRSGAFRSQSAAWIAAARAMADGAEITIEQWNRRKLEADLGTANAELECRHIRKDV